MNRAKKLVLAASLVAGVGLSLLVAAPANASTSDCPSIDFCLWDPGNYVGAPFLQTGYNVAGHELDFTQNIVSSGDNRRGVGGAYCAFDGDTGHLYGYFPINTALNFTGAANNSIDFVYYETPCTGQ